MGCFIKVIIVLIILLAIVFVVLQCGGSSCIRKIDKSLPSIDVAPWEVTTPTHVYYAEEVNKDVGYGDVDLWNWYEYFNGEWIKRDGLLHLMNTIYGDIKVRRR